MNISKFELDIIDRFNTILQKDELFLSIVNDKSRKTGYTLRLLDIREDLHKPFILFYWHDIQDVFYETKNYQTSSTFFQLNDIYDISNMPELKQLIGCHSLEEIAIKLDLLGVK